MRGSDTHAQREGEVIIPEAWRDSTKHNKLLSLNKNPRCYTHVSGLQAENEHQQKTKQRSTHIDTNNALTC